MTTPTESDVAFLEKWANVTGACLGIKYVYGSWVVTLKHTVEGLDVKDTSARTLGLALHEMADKLRDTMPGRIVEQMEKGLTKQQRVV